VHVQSEEGVEVEVREEEDELLRAAEELGIDLSPGSLRAAAREPTAEEVEEGAERADETGELVLPADEVLSELEVDLPADGGEPEEAVAAAGAEVEPLELDLADVDAEE
jgi:DNA-directed RNA polymerase subunit beta